MDERNPSIGFIGAGVFGKGLALALAAQGFRVLGVNSRSAAPASWLAERIPGCDAFATAQDLADAVDLVFITTPDSAINLVAADVSWRAGQGIVHCCGAASAAILQPAADQGAVTGAFHPFQTFGGLADPGEAAARLAGVTFAVAGSGWLDPFLWGLAEQLGGHPVSIPDDARGLYHAAAVLGCGHLAALIQAAAEVWQAMGFTQQQAIQALYPLCRTTLDAIAEVGVEAGVTGPVVRGDITTIRAHLEALFQNLPHVVPLYGALAEASLPLAAKRGAGPSQITGMQELIDHYTSVQ